MPNHSMFEAICDSNLDQVQRLVREDKRTLHAASMWGWSPLLIACYYEKHEIAKYLVEQGADVNSALQGSGNTSLHIAGRGGYESIVELLLENGADNPLKNNYGETAEQIAKTQAIRDLIRNHSKKTPTESSNTFDNKKGKRHSSPQPVDDIHSKKMKLAQLRHDYENEMATLDFEVEKQE